MNRRVYTKLTLMLAGLLVMIIGMGPVSAQDENLLTNPGFEGPYLDAGGGRLVAESWQPWNFAIGSGSPSYERQPGYEGAAPDMDRVRTDTNAQLIFTDLYFTYNAGVYQQVSGITPGTELRFSVYAWIWSSALDDREVSENPGDLLVYVGIDPNGGTDPTSNAIVWSPSAPDQYDAYRQYATIARANAATVTVFVWATADFPTRNNFVYLDDAVLEITPGGEVVPTNTSIPTQDDIGIIIPTNTSVPSNTPVPPSATPAPSNTPVPPSATALPSLTPVPPSATPIPSITPIPLPTNTPEDATPTREGATNTPAPTSEPAATATPQPTDVPAVETEPVEATPDVTDPELTDEPAAPTADPAFPGRIVYSVRRGDSVAKIASLYGSSIEQIIALNGLDDDALIFIDQQLIIPVRIQAVTATPSPTPEVQPTPIPAFGGGTYVVQAGDTLSRIAVRFNTTAAALAFNNGITNPNLIRVGQTLVVPVAGGAPSQPAQPTPVPDQPRTYVVQPGDNLYRISLRFNVPMVVIADANGILNANRIVVGQVLEIP